MPFFTLAEAVALLPVVRPLLQQMIDQHARLLEKQEEYERAVQMASSNGHTVSEKLASQQEEIELLAEGLRRVIAEIQQSGCVVKDLHIGLVDFPSQRDGRPINLCWRMDEPTIAYWHSMDSGYGSRQLL